MIILNALKSGYYNFVTTVTDTFCVTELLYIMLLILRCVELIVVLMKCLVISYNNGWTHVKSVTNVIEPI